MNKTRIRKPKDRSIITERHVQKVVVFGTEYLDSLEEYHQFLLSGDVFEGVGLWIKNVDISTQDIDMTLSFWSISDKQHRQHQDAYIKGQSFAVVFARITSPPQLNKTLETVNRIMLEDSDIPLLLVTVNSSHSCVERISSELSIHDNITIQDISDMGGISKMIDSIVSVFQEERTLH